MQTYSVNQAKIIHGITTRKLWEHCNGTENAANIVKAIRDEYEKKAGAAFRSADCYPTQEADDYADALNEIYYAADKMADKLTAFHAAIVELEKTAKSLAADFDKFDSLYCKTMQELTEI